MKAGEKVNDIKVDLKLSSLKPLHAGWLVHAFQNVKDESLKRVWVKTGMVDIALSN